MSIGSEKQKRYGGAARHREEHEPAEYSHSAEDLLVPPSPRGSSPAPRDVADDDPHKVEKIAKAGRDDFDPNDENEG